MSSDKQTAQIIRSVKEILQKSLDNPNELSKLIDSYLIPLATEKKKNAEVSTPYLLRQDMLNKMPADFWKTVKKVFEPCVGKGGFLVDIYCRFMDGLKDMYPDIEERKKVIVEQCLYFSDINPTNIYIARLLIDPHSKYKLNVNEGDTLKLNIQEKWGIDGFDAVIGNPPYNKCENSRHIIWNLFVSKSLNYLLKDGGYLLYVHPALWRKPGSERSKVTGLFELMVRNNTLRYLEIHNTTDGMRVFKCGTRYDWYLIEKGHTSFNTEIVDEDGVKHYLNFDNLNMNWLPNSNFDLVRSMTSCVDKVQVLYSRSNYGNDKKWMSRVKTEDYKYPCILSTPKSGVRYMYSSVNNKGHFGIKKVIFGETSTHNAFYDNNGEFGLTDGAIAIIDEEDQLDIINCLKSDKFQKLLKSCSWSNYRIEWNMFKDFNKEFWKEIV